MLVFEFYMLLQSYNGFIKERKVWKIKYQRDGKR